MPKIKYIQPSSIESKLKKYIRGQSVAEECPSLIEEWSSKNFYGPDLFGPGSGHRIIWTCEFGHTYIRPVLYRTRILRQVETKADRSVLQRGSDKNNGCLVCSGRIPIYKDSLDARHPDIAQEWHRFRNGGKSPREIHDNSNLLAFWRCQRCGHTFRMRVSSRTDAQEPQGCPACCEASRTNLVHTPEAYEQFDVSELNHGLDPSALPETHPAFWRCQEKGHLTYESFCERKSRGFKCLICFSTASRRYLSDYPELINQLVSIDGVQMEPSLIRAGSHKNATWRCDIGPDHVWDMAIFQRTLNNEGCPFCGNKRLSVTNSLANFPDVWREFHPFKNGLLIADAIIARTRQICWWLCAVCKHEWQRQVYLRTQHNSKCPRCKGKRERARQLLALDFRAGRRTNMEAKRN